MVAIYDASNLLSYGIHRQFHSQGERERDNSIAIFVRPLVIRILCSDGQLVPLIEKYPLMAGMVVGHFTAPYHLPTGN